ncbi:MAG: Gx transporter family protein [Candidatus Cloacimonadota bacterium]|nr:Gx transporter family protein [Candidatus Cloacimonadota bacterium]
MISEKISNNNILQFSFYSALAITIFVIENLIPKPIPFLKLGLSNAVILVLIFHKKKIMAIGVTIVKVIVGGFFSGSLFSPAFVMSVGGSIVAITIMIIFYSTSLNFGIVGISILGAISHNLTQIVVVRYVLIQNSEIFYLTPMMIILGLVTGIVTGLVAQKFISERKKNDKVNS